MQRPPLFSEVAARHGIQLKNCDAALAKVRHTDLVLILDTNPAPWKEFFVRASLLTPDSDWKLFAIDYSNSFDAIIYGNKRLPFFILPNLLKSNGLVVNVQDDCYFYRNQLE